MRFDDIGIDHDIVVDEDGSFTGTLPSTGLSGTLTFTALQQPEHGTLTITDTTTGAYTYTPTSGYHGHDTITIQVTDANGVINVHQVSFAVEADLDVQVAGKHLNFDGGDYIQVGRGTSDSLAITGDLTVEGWFRIDQLTGGTQSLAAFIGNTSSESSADNSLYELAVLSDGTVGFFMENGGGANEQLTTAQSVEVGEWVHLAAVRDTNSKTQTIYINGEQAGTRTYTNDANGGGNAQLTLGGRFSNGSLDGQLDGQMDDIRIWSEARSAEDIRQNYDQQLSGSETNLTAYYRFDDIQNGTVQDETSNNNDGTLGASDTLGDSAAPTVVDAVGGKSLKLDGTDDYVRFTDTYDTGTSFTVETWAWTDPDDTGGHVFSKDSLGSDTAGAANWEIGHGRIAYEKNNANSFIIDPELQAGAWNHYALVVSDQGGGNSEVKIYVNGELIHTATVSTVSVTNGGFLIGRRGFNNDSNFKGQLDDYRVWNTARTADQIAQNYQKTLAGTETGLIAYLTFDNDTSSVSESVSDNTGTLNGGASVVSGSTDGSLPPIYGNIVDTVENTSASGYMVTDNSVVGEVTYAINNGAGGTTTSFTTAKNGTVTIDAETGSWTYTPATNYAGSDTFTLVATGATSGTDSETITVNVAGAGDENSVGMPDGILQLDGTGDYISVAHNNALSFGTGQSFTLETWANLNDVATLQTLLDKSTAGDDANYRLAIENGEVKFFSPETGVVDVNFSISADTWTHIAVSYDADADTMTFYKDGTQVGSPVSITSVGDANSDMLFIGRDSQGRYVDGQMDEVRIWSDARTADEIAANYQKQLAGNENNLTAYYRFDDDPDGTTVANKATSTGNALDGTLTGDASMISVPLHAINFDGSNDTLRKDLVSGDSVLTGSSSFTYEMRVKTDASGTQTMMSIGENAGNVTTSNGTALRIESDGSLGFNRSTGDNAADVKGSAAINDGLWHHVAVSYDQSTGITRLFVDGEVVGVTTLAAFDISGGIFRIGTGLAGGNDFAGQISDVRIWNVARTANEVADNVNTHFTGNENGKLIAHYPLNEIVSNNVLDTSGTLDLAIVDNAGDDATLLATAPTIQGTIGDIQENATLSGQMSGNDVAGTPTYSVAVTGKTTSAADADGRVSVETANGGTVTIDTSSGVWTYKPANNWYGTDSFNITATGDNSTSDSETISVTVNNDTENSIVINDGVLHTTGAAGTHASGAIGTNTITNNVTIEFSVTLDEIVSGQAQTLLSVYDTTGNNGRFVINVTGTGKLQFFSRSSGGVNNSGDTEFTMSADTSYDIAVSYDGATKMVYVNGDLVHSEAVSGMSMSNTAQEIRIGTHFDGSSNPASALIDEVKVWSEVRTQDQIRDGIDQPVASGTNNLEAYYKFDDQVSGTAVQDQSGNNRDLTLNGDAQVINDLKGAVSFDGVDDVVTIANDTSLNSAQGTWSTWFKWDTTANPTNGAILMGRHDETTSYNGLLVAVENNGNLLIQGKDADSLNAEISVSNPGVNDGAWHQVTVVYDQAAGGLNKVYVDGQLVGSVQSSAAWNWGGQALQIGDSPDTHWTPWKGEIGPVQIYNTKLTDEQVADQFGNEVDPAASGLVGYYDFTEGSGSTAANDATGGTQAPDATVSGSTWIDLDNDTTATTLVIQEDEIATGHMLANDVPGTASYSVATNGQHGTVTMNTDGTWFYKPVANYYGTDTFTLRVSGTDADGTVFNDDETITVTINSVDDGNAVQISDGALSLDGVNDWVDLPNTILNASQGTVSMRVNLPADAQTGSFMPLFANRDDADGDRIYIIAEFTGGQWHLKATLDDKTIDGGVISTDTWYETTLVWRTDNTGEFYVDGDSKGSVSGLSLNAGTNSNVNDGVGLGTYDKASNNQHTKALIDEVSIWSTAQTADAIRTRVGQQLSGDESNLTAYYRFDDDADGNVVHDLTGNGNDGTLTNGAKIVDPATNAEPTVLGNEIEIQTSEIAAGSMTGIDVPGTPAYSIVGGTTTYTTANGGSVTINTTTGAWTYDPADGYYGSDSFTLRAASTHNSVNFTDDETVTVTIKSDTNVEAHDGVLQLDGNNSWANVGDANALDITGDFTLEAWIKPEGPGTNGLTGGVIAGKENAYLLARSPDGSITFALNGPNGTWGWTDTGYDAPLDTWTHLALAFDGSEQTVKLYANGELAATSTDGIIPTGITSGSGAFAIGGRPAQNEEFEGLIDDVRVWNDLRTADEIRENYDQKLSGSENGLAGYWSFDDATGTTVQDGTSNNNDATLAGNARVNNTLGASMEFDGNGDYVSTSGINLANKSFSWEFDAYRDSTANTDLALTSHDGTPGNQHFFHAGYLDGNTFRYSFNQTSGNYRIDYTDTTGPNGNGTDVWNHWAGTYDAESNVARLYLNGELVVTEVFDGDFLGTASLFIASTDPAQSTGHYFDGKLDNVRVWDGVRTGEEIQQNYNTVLTGDQSGKLLANYTFEETSGSTVTNTANSGTYDGTAVGDYNRVDVSPNIYTNAITIEENEVIQGNMNSAGADGSATFSVDTTNAHGTVTLNTSTGRWTYTPHENYNGSASFVLTATGANGTTDSETINVTINADAAQRSPVTNSGVLVLDGTNDFVKIADNNNLDFGAGQDFTLEAWINPNRTTGLNAILDKSADSGDDSNYRFYVRNDKLSFWSIESSDVIGTSTVKSGEWSHVAVSYDASTDLMTFYINGEQDGPARSVTSIGDINAGALRIGADTVAEQASPADRWFNGMIDDVRIWNDARTAEEIQANYDQLVSTGDNLVGHWTFDTTDGSTVTDRSGNNLTGTLTNGADVKNLPQNAIRFDGGDYIDAGAGTGNELRLDSDMTIELWVKPDAISGTQALITLGGKNGDDIAADTYLFGLNLKSDGTLSAFHENGSSEPGVTTLATLTAGEWAHVAVTRDVSERTYTVFINGEAVSTGTYSDSLDVVSAATATNATFKIGTQIDTDGASLTRTFTGDIADVRVWNTVRTDQQIADYHDQSIAGDVGGTLVAHYEFNETNGQTVTDTAGSNNATLGANNTAGTDDPTFVDGSPSIHSLSVAVQENDTASGTMTTIDVVPTSATFSVNSSASHSGTTSLTIANKGTVNIDSTGGWTFTPVDNFNGQVQFYVTASGGGMTDAEQITVDVQPVSVTSNEINTVAAVFDGVDDVLTATPSGMAVGTSSFTMETWFKTTGTTGALLDLGREVPNGSMKLFLSGGKLAVSRPGLEIINAAELTVNDGNWHHTSVVYDGGTDVVKLYVDGELVKSVSGITYDIQVGEIAIGGYNPVNAGLGTFDGQLADVRMWSTARTATEVRENYTQKLAGNETGLQAYYTFENRDGTSVNDVTSNNNDLQVTSVAATLNGTNQGYTVNNDASINIGLTGSFSLEGWVKTSGSGAYQRVLMKDANNLDGGQSYSLAVDANGFATVLFNHDNGGGSSQVISQVKVNDGGWHHIAGVFDNANDLLHIYVDGQLSNSLSTTGQPYQDDGNLAIGYAINQGGSTAGQYFNGQLDDVRVWNTARTADQIAANFQTTLTGNQSGALVANYTFEDSTGNDSAGSNNGAAVGTPTYTLANHPNSAAGPTYSDGGLDLLANSITINEDTTATGTMTASDVVGTASYSVTSAAQHGTVSINSSTGEWTYTPNSNYSGTDSFQLQATDGSFTDQETISVTIDADNDPSIAGSVLQSRGGANDSGSISGIDISNKSFTIEFWANRATDTSHDVILSQGTESIRDGLHIAYRGTDSTFDNKQFGFAFWGDDLNYTDTDTNVGEWVHWAMSFNNTTKLATLYKDGAEVATKTLGGSYTGTGTIKIAQGFSSSESFAGMLDDLRIWDDVRTADEIASNYNHQLAGNETNLIAYYTMEDPDGNIIRDKTSNNRDIKLNESDGINSIKLPTSAINLDGVDDHVEIGALSENISGAYTMEAWVKLDAFTANGNAVGWSRIIDIGQGEGDDNLFLAFQSTTGELALGTYVGTTGSGGTSTQVASPSAVPLNEWIHVAGVNDGAGNAYVYINGIKVATATGQNAAADVARNSNYIGKSNFSLDSFTDGQISDVRLWNVARSDAEIAANYNNQLTGNESGLVFNYAFDGLDGTTVIDNTANGNDGTANGGAGIVDTLPAIQGNSITLAFDDTASGVMSGADVVGTALYTVIIQPSHGTVQINSETGDWTYTPTFNYTGSDTFTLRATGATSGTDDETISLTVTGAPDATNTPTQSALQFDGVDDYVNIGPMSENISGAYTMEAWVYYNPAAFTNNGWMRIIDLSQGENDDNLLLAIDPGSDVFSFDTRNGGTVSAVKSDSTVSTGEWIHVAGVNDGTGNGYLYINGELVKTETGQQVAQDVVRLNNYIGQSAWSNESPMHGAISDVRIWNDARTSEEIKANYNKTLTGSEDSLVAYYTFEGIANGVVRDITNNGNDAQIINNSADPGVAATGPTGDVLQVNGSNNMTTASDPELASKSFTIEFWANRTSADTGDMVYQQGPALGNQQLGIGWQVNTNRFNVSFYDNDLIWDDPAGDEVGEWHHWAITYDFSNNARVLYKDGVAVANDTATSAFLGAGTANIGVNFNGQLDNFRIWHEARTADEIRDGMSTSYDFDTTNLVAQYTFDDVENSATVLDSAHSMSDGVRNSNNDGTLNNGATVVDSGYGGGIAVSHLDKAIRFDGTNDAVSDPSDTIGALGAAERTIMLWARSSSEEPQTLVSYGDNSSAGSFRFGLNGWDVDTNTHGGKGITVDIGNGAITFQPLTGTDDGQWHHYAVVLPSGGDSLRDLKVYQDGQLLTTISALFNNEDTTINTQSGALNLGHFNNTAFFNGDMAEVSVWSTGLTTAQINEYMNDQLKGDESGLSAYWRGSDNGSGAVNDYADSNDLTLSNGASIVDVAPDITSNSLRISEDTIATGQVTTSGVNSSATYTVQTAAGNGTVTIDSATGVWNYQPNAGYSGTDTFTLRATGNVETEDEVISVRVGQDPVLPSSYSLSLDGTDDFVDVPLDAVNDMATSGGTIETWAYFDSVTSETIFAKQHDGSNTYALFSVGHTQDGNGSYQDSTDGKVFFQGLNGGANLESTTTLQSGQWYHLAVTFTGSEARLYIDGQLDKIQSGNFSVPDDISSGTSPSARIGEWQGKPGDMDGRIADFRVWNDVRTDNEIANSYDKQLNGDEQGLAGYWTFEEGTGSIASDQSGNGNDATIVGGTHENMTSISMSAGATYKGLILGADADSNDALSYTVSSAANGTLSLDTDGSFEYTNSTNADDSFDVTISDSDGNQTVETIHIDVP